jgi:hypothetical protein
LEANAYGGGGVELKDLETIQIGYVIFDSQFNLLQK